MTVRSHTTTHAGELYSRKTSAHEPGESQVWGMSAFGVPERTEHRRLQALLANA